MSELILPFLTGGILVASISYLANHVSTKWAAILTSLNMSLIGTIFMTDRSTIIKFIFNEFILMLVVSGMSLLMYLFYGKLHTPYIVSLLLSYLFYFFSIYGLYDYYLR